MYWDNNATAPILPEVKEAMLPYLSDQFYNPSAGYRPARHIREMIDESRHYIAQILGVSDSEIIFTSGGTEATNTAYHTMTQVKGKGIVTLSTDHPASIEAAKGWGKEALLCPVDGQGRALVESWADLCSQKPQGVSFAWANNETGVIQSAQELINVAHSHGCIVHVDAVQALGKIPVNLRELQTDFASLSAHKIHGPKGIGCLMIKSGIHCEPLLYGGGQEWAKRSGTENIAGIAGFGAAAKYLIKQGETMMKTMKELHQLWEEGISSIEGATIHGCDVPRLPNTTHVRFESCSAESLILLLEPQGILCSAGSACATLNPHTSHVLQAMGLSDAQARGGIRFSLSSLTSKEEVLQSLDILKTAVNKVRSVQSNKTGPVLVFKP